MLARLKLHTLLAAMLLLIWRARKTSARLRELLQRDPRVVQIEIAGGASGYFEVRDGTVRLRYGRHTAPDFCQTWRCGHEAFRVLTSRDETDLLRSFEEGAYRMRGDFLAVLWFNEVMKLARGPL